MSENQNPQQSPPNKNAERQERQDRMPPLVIELADQECRNFTFNTPPLAGLIIRGRWDVARLASRPQGLRSLGEAGSQIPTPIPGYHITIDFRRRDDRAGTVTVSDPLETTEEGKAILKRFNKLAERFPALRRGEGGATAMEAIEYPLDKDQLKTLMYEILRKRASGIVIVHSGSLPDDAKDLDSMPGDELYDPQNSSTEKPRFKKDLERHRERLRAAGVA